MKIIFSTYETKEIGGSYLRSLSLAKGLSKQNHQLVLWTSAKKLSLIPKFSEEDGVKIIESIGIFPYRFRKGGYDPFDVILRIVVILFSKCNIIHSFNHRPASTLPALFKSIFCKNCKWFLDWADLWGKGGIADRRYGPFHFFTSYIDHYTERLFIKLAFAVTAISDDLFNKAIKFRDNKQNVYFLGVGANIDDIKVMSQVSARKILKFSKDIKILIYLYVGTYDEELLAHIFIALNKLRSDTRLLLLGPRLTNFEQILYKHPQLKNKVWNQGVVERQSLSIYLAAGDLMLLPFSNKEINRGKFPNKIGDYLAAGRAMIANPTGEVKKILNKEKVGFLASEDPAEFAKTIDKVLNQTRKLQKLGRKARLLAERISWSNLAKELEGFYLK